MLRFRIALLAWMVLTSVPTHSYADSFDTFGDHEKLRGLVVLAAGNISTFSSSQFSETDPLQPRKPLVYKIDNFCFGLGAPSFLLDSDLSGKAALLMIDQFKNASLAQLSGSISQVKVSVKPITLYDCGATLQRQGNDLKRQLELQLQKNKIIMENLKRQQQ